MSYSTIATIDNLNTVYSDIRHRIDALGDVYSVKGSLKFSELDTVLKKAIPGDVYNIIEVPTENTTFSNGDNVVCIENNSVKSWAKLGGVYELATNDTAGLVFLGENKDFDDTEANKVGHVEFGLNMGTIGISESVDGKTHKTYVKVPFANKDKYGLVSTEAQTFAGNKTFDGKVIVGNNTTKTTIANNSITVGEKGDTSTGTLTINGGVTADNSSFLGNLTVNNTTTTQNLSVNTNTDGTVGNITVNGTATVNSTYTTTNLNVLDTTEVDYVTTSEEVAIGHAKNKKGVIYVNTTDDGSGDISITTSNLDVEKDFHTTILQANTVSVGSPIIADTLSTDDISATYVYTTNLGTSSKPVTTVFATTVKGKTNDYITTLNTDTVTVTNLTGTGDNSTLNAKTINAVGSDGSVTMKYVPQYGTIIAGNNNTQAPYKGFLIGDPNTEADKNTGLYVSGHLYAHKVHNAVWNDLADAIEIDVKPEYGYVYCFDGEHYSKSSKYCQKGVIGIHSDTAGMIMGEKGSENELNCAVAGFVLAHVDKVYSSGTPLTTGKNGVLTKMKKKDLILHPDRLVANFWKAEVGEKWNGVEVNNRCWVKVR